MTAAGQGVALHRMRSRQPGLGTAARAARATPSCAARRCPSPDRTFEPRVVTVVTRAPVRSTPAPRHHRPFDVVVAPCTTASTCRPRAMRTQPAMRRSSRRPPASKCDSRLLHAAQTTTRHAIMASTRELPDIEHSAATCFASVISPCPRAQHRVDAEREYLQDSPTSAPHPRMSGLRHEKLDRFVEYRLPNESAERGQARGPRNPPPHELARAVASAFSARIDPARRTRERPADRIAKLTHGDERSRPEARGRPTAPGHDEFARRTAAVGQLHVSRRTCSTFSTPRSESTFTSCSAIDLFCHSSPSFATTVVRIQRGLGDPHRRPVVAPFHHRRQRIRIASVRPLDCSPNRVPRSQTR